MIPAPFAYAAPKNLNEAVALLTGTEGSALVAGGQTMVTDLKLRRASPRLLVDLRKLGELRGIRRRDGHGGLRLGALTTLAELTEDPSVQREYPALAEAAALIGDPQVRHRATLGGNLMAGITGADLPAVILALDATIFTVGPRGERTLPADSLLSGPLERGEIVTAVELPPVGASAGNAYEKFKIPASGFALCGVAASLVRAPDMTVAACRVAVTGAVARAARLNQVEAGLIGRGLSRANLAAVSANASQGLDLVDDLAASAEYRGHLTGVLAEQALGRAAERAGWVLG